MNRLVGGVLVLLLALPPLWAEDKPKEKDKDKPAAPAQQYKALLAEYQKAERAFQDAIVAAKTPEERMKVFREKNPSPRFAPKFLALAEKHPKDAIALDALSWVVTNGSSSAGGKDDTQARALKQLARDHVQSDRMAAVCQSLSFGFDLAGDTLLRAVLEKNKSKEAQAEACLALAQRLQRRVEVVKRLKDNADLAKAFEGYYGKDLVAQLKKADAVKVEAESAKLFKLLADKHVADMKLDRLKNLCQMLSYSGGKGGEVLMRALLEKDTRREVQGIACLTLAKMLKQRADTLAQTDARAAKKVRAECEKLFERGADKYGDVKLAFGGTVAAKAKSELFDLRFLAVGNKAPDVGGEDQDGKKFKLSDYKGKVVLLDFWSQY